MSQCSQPQDGQFQHFTAANAANGVITDYHGYINYCHYLRLHLQLGQSTLLTCVVWNTCPCKLTVCILKCAASLLCVVGSSPMFLKRQTEAIQWNVSVNWKDTNDQLRSLLSLMLFSLTSRRPVGRVPDRGV